MTEFGASSQALTVAEMATLTTPRDISLRFINNNYLFRLLGTSVQEPNLDESYEESDGEDDNGMMVG